MLFRLFRLVPVMLALVCLPVVVSAADDHGGSANAAAEENPEAANGHDDAAHGEEGHGDHGHDAGHHDPYEDALHSNAGPSQGSPAEWKMSLAIWTLVVFGCLLSILWKFAWGPICAALADRERAIQANIDAAKEQTDKASALLAEHEARLAGTADEVRKILDEARRDAESQKQSILAEAEAAADSQKKLALQEIAAAKNGALQELAEKSVDTAVGLAGKIVKRQLSQEDHASLISEAISNFPSKN